MISRRTFFEDFVVNDSRETTGRTITEADIVLHAGQTGDFYPHHIDAEWCKSQPFGQRIAHGTLIFSIAIGMTASVINDQAMTYGYDRLRFIQPVFIGDTIKTKITIRDKKPYKKPEFGLITESIEVFNQHGKLVMVCEHIVLSNKREAKQENE